MSKWLESIGFGVYAKHFKKESIDGKKLLALTMDDMMAVKVLEKHALLIQKQLLLLKVLLLLEIYAKSIDSLCTRNMLCVVSSNAKCLGCRSKKQWRTSGNYFLSSKSLISSTNFILTFVKMVPTRKLFKQQF